MAITRRQDIFIAIFAALLIHGAAALINIPMTNHALFDTKDKSEGEIIISLAAPSFAESINASAAIAMGKYSSLPLQKLDIIDLKMPVPTPQPFRNAAAKEILSPDSRMENEAPVSLAEAGMVEEEPAKISAIAVEHAQPPESRNAQTYAHPRYHENQPPIYPTIARKKGYEGTVMLIAHVCCDGTVDEVKLKNSSGHAPLDHSALYAVKGWKYTPAYRNSVPIDSWALIPIRFTLNNRDPELS